MSGWRADIHVGDGPVVFKSETRDVPPPSAQVQLGDLWEGPDFQLLLTENGWERTSNPLNYLAQPIPAPTGGPRVMVTPGDVIDPRAQRRAAVGTAARHGLILLATLAAGFALGIPLGAVLL